MKNEVVISELRKTLPGRIRLNVFHEITGKSEAIPTKRQVQKYIKKNALVDSGSIFFYFKMSMLNIELCSSVNYNRLKVPLDLESLFEKLEKHPLENPIIILISDCCSPFPKKILFWINCMENEEDEGFVYTVFGYQNETIDDPLLNFEFETAKKPLYEKIRGIGYEADEVNLQEYINLMISVLDHITDNFVHGAFNNLDKRNLPEKFALNSSPPFDEKLMDNLDLLLSGKLKCTKGFVDIRIIKPFSYDFCLSYPDSYIKRAQIHKEKILEKGMLVYEENGKLIMSDDYSSYLALKKERVKKIMVVVIGKTNVEIEKIAEGGRELLPVSLPMQTPIDELSDEYKDQLLNNRLDELSKLDRIQRISNSSTESLKKKIKDNNISEVFEDLFSIVEEDIIRNELFLMLGRYTKLKSDSRKRIISKEYEDIIQNQIIDSLLQLIDEIGE